MKYDARSEIALEMAMGYIEDHGVISEYEAGSLWQALGMQDRTEPAPQQLRTTDEYYSLLKKITTYEYFSASVTDKSNYFGVNSIGFKTPYMATEVFDDTYTSGWQWPEDEAEYLDYFEHFAGHSECGPNSCGSEADCCRGQTCEDLGIAGVGKVCTGEGVATVDPEYLSKRYIGLLPEVERYYISMVRDQRSKNLLSWAYTGWGVSHSQKPARFHLVSPCSADLIVRVTQCECYGTPTEQPGDTWLANLLDTQSLYETGEYNSELGQVVDNFDGTNKMLYQIDPATGNIIKQCNPKKAAGLSGLATTDLMDMIFDDEEVLGTVRPYKPLCIEIDPIMFEDREGNYCYRGIKPTELASLGAVTNYVLPVTCGVVAAVGSVGTGAIPAMATCSVIGSGINMVLEPVLEAGCYKWPIHGGASCIFKGME